jgi:hypothetical protein
MIGLSQNHFELERYTSRVLACCIPLDVQSVLFPTCLGVTKYKCLEHISTHEAS